MSSDATNGIAIQLYFGGTFCGKPLEHRFDGCLNMRHGEVFLAYCVALVHRKELSATQYNKMSEALRKNDEMLF